MVVPWQVPAVSSREGQRSRGRVAPTTRNRPISWCPLLETARGRMLRRPIDRYKSRCVSRGVLGRRDCVRPEYKDFHHQHFFASRAVASWFVLRCGSGSEIAIREVPDSWILQFSKEVNTEISHSDISDIRIIRIPTSGAVENGVIPGQKRFSKDCKRAHHLWDRSLGSGGRAYGPKRV